MPRSPTRARQDRPDAEGAEATAPPGPAHQAKGVRRDLVPALATGTVPSGIPNQAVARLLKGGEATAPPGQAQQGKEGLVRRLDPDDPRHRTQVEVFLHGVVNHYARHGFGPWVEQYDASEYWDPPLGLHLLDLDLWHIYSWTDLRTFDEEQALRELPRDWDALRPVLERLGKWAQQHGIRVEGYNEALRQINEQVVGWLSQRRLEARMGSPPEDLEDPEAFKAAELLEQMAVAAEALRQMVQASHRLGAAEAFAAATEGLGSGALQKLAEEFGAKRLDVKTGVEVGAEVLKELAAAGETSSQVIGAISGSTKAGLDLLAEVTGGWEEKQQKLVDAGLLSTGEGAAELLSLFAKWGADAGQLAGRAVAVRSAGDGRRIAAFFTDLPEDSRSMRWSGRLAVAARVGDGAAGAFKLIDGIVSGDRDRIREASTDLAKLGVEVGVEYGVRQAVQRRAVARLTQAGLSRAVARALVQGGPRLLGGVSGGVATLGGEAIYRGGKAMLVDLPKAESLWEASLRRQKVDRMVARARATSATAHKLVSALREAERTPAAHWTSTTAGVGRELRETARQERVRFISQMKGLIGQLREFAHQEPSRNRYLEAELGMGQRAALIVRLGLCDELLAELHGATLERTAEIVTQLCRLAFRSVSEVGEEAREWRGTPLE